MNSLSDQKDLTTEEKVSSEAEDTAAAEAAGSTQTAETPAAENDTSDASAPENADLPKPANKKNEDALDVSVEDHPVPVEGSEQTRAQKVAQIREALSMVERPAAPQTQPAKNGSLPPLRKKGTKGAAARNTSAETVAAAPKTDAPKLQAPAQKPVGKLPPLKSTAAAAQKTTAPAQKTAAAPTAVRQPLPPLRKAGTKTVTAPSKGEAVPGSKPASPAKKAAASAKPAPKKKSFPKLPLPIGKLAAILGGSVGGALLLAYIITAIVYANKFLPNTYINHLPVGGMSKQEAHDALMERAEVADLELITSEGDTVTFPAEEYNAYYSMELERLDEAFSENSLLWVGKLFKESMYTVEYDINYDPKVMQLMFERYGWGSDPSRDAYIVMNADTGLYEIVPETIGDKFDKSVLVDYLGDQLRTGNFTVNMVESGCYDNYLADIREEDLQEHLELCNKYAKCAITFDFSDRKEVLDGETIASWVLFTDEGKSAFNRNLIEEFVAAMAEKYDTYGRSRTFRSTLDGVITVPWTKTSIYGWQIDQEATTEQILELLEAGESVTVEPKYTNWGYGFCRDTNDIGNTYIEVDISAQHVWYYKDGIILMESDCVTGVERDPDRRTPRGIFEMWSREKNRVLGQMEDEGYETFVNYWMPINYTGVGLHDAVWQSSFGGTRYLTGSGSHGCINLPLSFAKNLYNSAESGTPVIVHD